MAHCLERLLVLCENAIGRKRRAGIDQCLMRRKNRHPGEERGGEKGDRIEQRKK